MDIFSHREIAEKVESYIAGYERDPEGDDDIEAALALALPGLAAENAFSANL